MIHPIEFATAAVAFCLALVTSVHAILRRRDPRAALCWVFTVWVFPIVGCILYYLFGINRIERKATARRRHRRHDEPVWPATFHSRAGDPQSGFGEFRHLYGLTRAVDRVVSRPLTTGNKVEHLVNGDEAYPAMIKAIDEAQKSVALSTYIFNNDRAGKIFIEALGRAVERGVQVRVLLDDVGSGFFWSSVRNQLRDRKVPLAYFMPTLVPWRVAYFNMRNHRKILTVDGRVGFTGGINVSRYHMLEWGDPNACLDVHFRLEGPVVGQMQEAFADDWHFTTGERLTGQDWFPEVTGQGRALARGIAGGPDEDFEKTRWTILAALSKAQKRIKVVTPYLILDPTLVGALNTAALGGLEVDVVLPAISDLSLVNWATEAQLWQIVQRGVRVWKTPPPFNHSKMTIVDGVWTLFGSTNWDPRSLRLNFEFDVECYDKELAMKLEKLVEERIKSARPITLEELDARPLPIKLRDGLARLASPFL